MKCGQRWKVVAIVAAVFLAATSATRAQDFHFNFRGAKLDEGILRYNGANAEKFVKPEAEGLRITFTPGNAPKQPVGVDFPSPVGGDFIITAQYEILKFDPPTKGQSVGVELYLMPDTPPPRDGIAFARRVRPDGTAFYHYVHRTNDANGNRISKVSQTFITTDASQRGRLRLSRKGTILTASMAEGDKEEFIELIKEDLGDMVIRMTRIGGMPGDDLKANLDMRVLELRLQTAEPEVAVVPVPAPDEATKFPWFLLTLLPLFLLIATFGTIAVWLLVRRNKAKAPKAEESAAAPAKTTPAQLIVTCGACGKKLKVKPSSAGRHVHCPGCNEKVPVPAAQPPDTSIKRSRY